MPAPDTFHLTTPTLLDPFTEAFSISPSDGADLATTTRGIMVTVAGNVSVITKAGSTVTLPALQPGVVYPFRVQRVRATGTTATGIIGAY